MYIPQNWEFGAAFSKLRNFGKGGFEPPNHPLGGLSSLPMQATRRGGSIAPTHSQTRMKWVVRLQPLYLRERAGTICTGGWVSLGFGLGGTENLA
jgi:hypothetical protein